MKLRWHYSILTCYQKFLSIIQKLELLAETKTISNKLLQNLGLFNSQWLICTNALNVYYEVHWNGSAMALPSVEFHSKQNGEERESAFYHIVSWHALSWRLSRMVQLLSHKWLHWCHVQKYSHSQNSRNNKEMPGR